MLTGLLVLLTVGFWLWSIFDVITAPAGRIRVFGKITWLAIVVILYPIGSVCWFFFGRTKSSVSSRAQQPPGVAGSSHQRVWAPQRESVADLYRARKPGPPIGPDDDPEFLKRL